METWSHGICALSKIAKQNTRLDYAGLGMFLQIECNYLSRTVHRVGTLMGTIKETLRETFLPAIFVLGGGFNAEFRKIIDHDVKCGRLGIPYPVYQRSMHISPPTKSVGNW